MYAFWFSSTHILKLLANSLRNRLYKKWKSSTYVCIPGNKIDNNSYFLTAIVHLQCDRVISQVSNTRVKNSATILKWPFPLKQKPQKPNISTRYPIKFIIKNNAWLRYWKWLQMLFYEMCRHIKWKYYKTTNITTFILPYNPWQWSVKNGTGDNVQCVEENQISLLHG